MNDLVDRLLFPLLASNISLLFALISRNGMVSQRIRELCKELADDSCSIERGNCLISQIAEFKNRYRLNKAAVSSALVAVPLLLIAAVSSSSEGATDVFGILSIIAFIGAIGMTLYDFVRATETLEKEVAYSSEKYGNRVKLVDNRDGQARLADDAVQGKSKPGTKSKSLSSGK
ncbi:MAG: DUF2721 domain-containing protein [Planctomycetota bacterium]